MWGKPRTKPTAYMLSSLTWCQWRKASLAEVFSINHWSWLQYTYHTQYLAEINRFTWYNWISVSKLQWWLRLTTVEARPEKWLLLCQTLACRLACAKPLSEPMLEYCWLDPWEYFSEILIEINTFFLLEHAFENVVCEIMIIFSRPQCVTDQS